MFEVIVAARESLTRGLIASATGLDAVKDLPRLLGGLASLVPVRDGRYPLFHRSLFEWLTGWDNEQDQPFTEVYHISLVNGHKRLADWCWSQYKRGIQNASAYCLRHLVAHLREADRSDDVRSVLLDFDFLQAKLEATDSNALIADYDYLPEDSDLRTVKSVLRQSAHILVHDGAQLAAQLLARISIIQDAGIQQLLDGARGWSARPWLRPRTASLAETAGTLLTTFRGHEADGHAGTPRSMAFSRDGAWLATAGNSANDCTVKIWSVRGTRIAQTFQNAAAASGVTQMLFLSPERLAVANNEELRIYKLDENKPADVHSFDSMITSLAPALAEDGVIVGLADGMIASVGKTRGHSLLRKSDGQSVGPMVVSHDGAVIAYVVSSGIECRSLTDAKLVGQVEAAVDQATGLFWTVPLAFGSEGRLLFGATLKVWALGEAVAARVLPDQEGPVLAISSSGTRVLLLIDGHTILARRLAPTNPVAYLSSPHHYSCCAISADGSVAATGDYEHDVKVWDPRAHGSPADRLGSVKRVAIANDNRRAVVFRQDQSAEVWELETGRKDGPTRCLVPRELLIRNGVDLLDPSASESVRQKLAGRISTRTEDMHGANPIGALAFSWSARCALSAASRYGKGADTEEPPAPGDVAHALHVWKLEGTALESTVPSQPLYGHTMAISCIAITHDGRFGLTGSIGRLIRLWDLKHGTCVHVLRGHKGRLFAVALSDDGRLAVSGSEDMTLRLWDLRAGQLLYTFTGTSAIQTCDIAPDGSWVIAGEWSGRVHWVEVAALVAHE